ncbi:hypothetical protein JTB14_009083 [Gonioctena quinquepunctata]|nr:hypothetical protein JTB14_009083 [Gonioctena quinquepunctata]
MENCPFSQECNELEAWKLMMDSMVKFINASTKLMNTFNIKASNANFPNVPEIECLPCGPKSGQEPKKFICAAVASQMKAKASKIPSQGTENVKETPQEKISANENKFLEEEIPKAGAEYDETGDMEAVEDDEPPPADDKPPPADDTTIVDLESTTKSTEIDEPPKKSKDETVPDICNCKEVKVEDTCNCKEVKPVKATTEKAAECEGKCSCSGKKSKLELCACPVTSKETLQLTTSMAEKLVKAQTEIDSLKQELEKIQFMEYARKSNTAALYQQIMKDPEVNQALPRRMNSSTRQGMTAGNSTPMPFQCPCATTMPSASTISHDAQNTTGFRMAELHSSTMPSFRTNTPPRPEDSRIPSGWALNQATPTRGGSSPGFSRTPYISPPSWNEPMRSSFSRTPPPDSWMTGQSKSSRSGGPGPRQVYTQPNSQPSQRYADSSYSPGIGPPCARYGPCDRNNTFGPPFDNVMTGMPQMMQSQSRRGRGYGQMRRKEVECKNRQSKKLGQVVTVCTPPRDYAAPGMYQDSSAFENQGYEEQCDNYNCENDDCDK